MEKMKKHPKKQVTLSSKLNFKKKHKTSHYNKSKKALGTSKRRAGAKAMNFFDIRKSKKVLASG
jgi:hypothetical protein